MSEEKGQALVSGGERFCVSFVRTALLLRQGTACWILMVCAWASLFGRGWRGRCWLRFPVPQPRSRLGTGSSGSQQCGADGERGGSVPRPGWDTRASQCPPGYFSELGSSGTFSLSICYLLPRNTVHSKAGCCIHAMEVYWCPFDMDLVNFIKLDSRCVHLTGLILSWYRTV